MTNSDQTWDWVLEAPDYPGALLACLLAQRGQRVLWQIRPSLHLQAPVIGVDHRLYRQLGLEPPHWPFSWVQYPITQSVSLQGSEALDGVLLQRTALLTTSRHEAQQLGVQTVPLETASQAPHLRIRPAHDRCGHSFQHGIYSGAPGVPGLLEHHQQPCFYSTYLGQRQHLLGTESDLSQEDLHLGLTWHPRQTGGPLHWEIKADIPTLYWPNYALSPQGLWAESQALLVLRRLSQLMSDLPPASDWADLSHAYQQQLSHYVIPI
jgi:hypothetical protein